VISHAVVPGLAFSAATHGASTPSGPVKLAACAVEVEVGFRTVVPAGEAAVEAGREFTGLPPDAVSATTTTVTKAAATTTPIKVLGRDRRVCAERCLATGRIYKPGAAPGGTPIQLSKML
jgi:hypothetical protein